MRASHFYATTKPSPDTIMVLELCISDKCKPVLLVLYFVCAAGHESASFSADYDNRYPWQMLLANESFVPYLVDGLLLNPAHPRAGLDPELKAWLQRTHAECLAQLALFPPGRAALRGDAAVLEALEALAEVQHTCS